jgi:hypothetical protein
MHGISQTTVNMKLFGRCSAGEKTTQVTFINEKVIMRLQSITQRIQYSHHAK